jgi:hypothetical protein
MSFQPINIQHEVAAYFDLPPIPCTSCPRGWWRENESRFPALAGVIRRYLGAPCTTVASERLSATSLLISATVWLLKERR